jgi:hypothetical protein
MSELFGIGSFLSQHLCSPLARPALAGAAGAGSGEDSSRSLSQSALSTQDLCGAIARRRRPAGTRNDSTDPDVAASRLCSGRIAGIESAAADGNDRQPRYDTAAGEVDVRPSPGGEGAGPGRRRLGLAEATAVRDHAHGSRAATSGRSASRASGGELCRVASPASWSGNDHTGPLWSVCRGRARRRVFGGADQQVQARAELAGNVEAKRSGRATLIQARRQRCRQARHEKYLAVVDLGHQGHTQLAIAEKFAWGRRR